jgi:hypothetical protein
MIRSEKAKYQPLIKVAEGTILSSCDIPFNQVVIFARALCTAANTFLTLSIKMLPLLSLSLVLSSRNFSLSLLSQPQSYIFKKQTWFIILLAWVHVFKI